jgi:glycosyltransferase involved in cell wall biosynthesis
VSDVSIVIATKDRAGFLSRALESLARQRTSVSFEVIVADNGSTDATPDVVERAVRVAPHPLRRIEAGNANRALARNDGIAAASGELVLFVDDDVWLPPGFVSAHAAAHRERNGVPRAVTGPIVNVASYDEQPRPSAANFSRAFFCTCNASVPKSALDGIGGFDETFDLYGWEDTEIGLRLRDAGVQHAFAWDAFLYHIKPPEPLERAVLRSVEKAMMAARLIRKSPGLRTRLATGAYPLNLLRAKLMSPLLPVYAGVASSTRLPKPLVAYARSRLLDGVYVERLARALGDEDCHKTARC